MNVAPIPPGEILFPTLLYGSANGVRSAWRRVTSRAIRSRSWDEIFASFEYVPVEQYPGDIIISQIRRGGSEWRKGADWHLQWIPTIRPQTEVALRGATQESINNVIKTLVFSGMKSLWFTLGMLEINGAHMLLLPRDSDENYEDQWYRPILQQYIFWLPEMLTLAPRFSCNFIDAKSSHVSFAYFWMNQILTYAANVGYPRRWSSLRETENAIDNRWSKSPLAFLLGEGIVEQVGERYRLKPLAVIEGGR